MSEAEGNFHNFVYDRIFMAREMQNLVKRIFSEFFEDFAKSTKQLIRKKIERYKVCL